MVCGNSNLETDDKKLFNKCKNCIEQENYIKGEKLFKKFAKTELARLDPEMEFESIQGIATCHLRLGQYDSAIQLAREVLAKRLAFYRNENHHFVLNSETNLATALMQSRDNVVEAEKILRSCYEKKKRILGLSHVDTITCRNALQMALVYQRKFDEAKEFEMDLSQKTDFSNTMSLQQYIITSHNQAISLMEQNRYFEAKSMMTKGLTMSVETFGENDVLTASFEHNLGNCLRNLNELKEAEIYLRSSLRKRTGLLGNRSYDTLLSMSELGRILRLKGQFDEAESHLNTFLKAMEKQNQLNQASEQNVFMAKKILIEIYIERRDFKKAETLLTDTIESVYNKFDTKKVQPKFPWRKNESNNNEKSAPTMIEENKTAELKKTEKEAVSAVMEQFGIIGLSADHYGMEFFHSLVETYKIQGKHDEADELISWLGIDRQDDLLKAALAFREK